MKKQAADRRVTYGTQRRSCNIQKKLRRELPYNLVILHFSVFIKKNMKTLIQKIYTALCLLHHYLQYPRYGNRLKCQSMDEWIKMISLSLSLTHTHTHYSAIKRWNLAICVNMNGSWSYMLREIRQRKKDTYTWFNSYVEYLKNRLNKQTEPNKNRHKYREQGSDYQCPGGSWEGRQNR